KLATCSTPSSSSASTSASAWSRKSLKSRKSPSTSGCTSRVVSTCPAGVSRSSTSSSPSCSTSCSGVVASLTTKRTCSLTYTALANGHRFRPITAFSSQRRVSARTFASSSAPSAGLPASKSVTEVLELQRDAEIALAQQGDGLLQVVALLAVDPQLLAVDLAVDLELGVLVRGMDLLGRLALDVLPDGDLLPRAGQVGLDVAEFQAADVDAAGSQALLEDVGHLLELEVAGRGLADDVVVQGELRVDALEVEAGGQFAAGLVDCIGQLVGVHFGHDVERRHWDTPGAMRTF